MVACSDLPYNEITNDMIDKISAFEYLFTKLVEWGDSLRPCVPKSSFTRLKVLRLLFFVASIKDQNDSDLLDIFNNFFALPNGPVESDIYERITSDSLPSYSFKNFSFSMKKEYTLDNLDDTIKARIDASIRLLYCRNRIIVSYSIEQLVELSHTWKAWQSAMSIAAILGKGSYPMSVNSIRTSSSLFSL